MMKFKQILKKAWLPALTVLAICAGAVVLNATMRKSEALQLEQIALNAAEETEVPTQIATETAMQGDTETAVVTPTPSPAAQPMFKPTGDYSYILVESEDGSEPGAQDINSFEAGRTVAGLMEAVFGDAFTSGSHDIYLIYRNDTGNTIRGYDVLVGSSRWVEATFTGYINSVSGVVTHIEKKTPESEQIEKSGSDFENKADSLMTEARNDTRLTDVAKNLINTRFANGRTIENAMVDGIQVDFNDPDRDVVADCIIGMSEGDCYLVRMAYPSREVVMFEVYPIGWEGLWGYMNAEDFSGQPDWQTAPGVTEGPAVETPRPTTSPVSTQNSAS